MQNCLTSNDSVDWFIYLPFYLVYNGYRDATSWLIKYRNAAFNSVYHFSPDAHKKHLEKITRCCASGNVSQLVDVFLWRVPTKVSLE